MVLIFAKLRKNMQTAKVLRVINGLVRGVGFGTLGFESLRNSIVGLRLNFTDTGGTYFFSLVCVGLNSRGVAALSERNPRNGDEGGCLWVFILIHQKYRLFEDWSI